METLAEVSHKHPQSAYEGLQNSLQHEWEFVQRFTPGIGNAFGPVEKALRETLVPALFEGLGDGVPEGGVTHLPVKQAVLNLPDPSQTAPENWTASCVITGHAVAALRGQVEFRTADHSDFLQESRTAVWKRGQRRAEEALPVALEGAPVQRARRLRRATKIGDWLTVQPFTVNGTELGAQEWRDALFLWYVLEPPDLPTHCDGCHTKFLISHILDCKKGGLITARHNELRNRVADLAGKALNPSHVRDDPLIYSGRATKRMKATPARASEKKIPGRSAAAGGNGAEGRPTNP